MTHAINFKPQPVPKLKRFQEFIFVSDSALDRESESARQLHLTPNSSWLTEVKIGNSIEIEQIYAPQNIVRQLRNLQFQSGQKARLVSKSATGSIVVNLNDRAIGIGAEIARRIVVTFVDEKKS